MGQSLYTQVSKKIGLPGFDFSVPVKYPTIERAVELVTLAEGNDLYAFETVFRFVRFAESPENLEQANVMDVMYNGFLRLRRIYG